MATPHTTAHRSGMANLSRRPQTRCLLSTSQRNANHSLTKSPTHGTIARSPIAKVWSKNSGRHTTPNYGIPLPTVERKPALFQRIPRNIRQQIYRQREQGMDCQSDGYVMGVDVGTTSVKTVVFKARTKSIVHSHKVIHHSDVPSHEFREQDPFQLIRSLEQCIISTPGELLARVSAIGVSGQMHGVVLWSSGQVSLTEEATIQIHNTSNLVTWEDNRCEQDFIQALPNPRSNLSLASGFGCVTLLWLLRNKPEYLSTFDCAGTIADLVVCIVAGLSKPTMSPQMAASWGYFDPTTSQWNLEILKEASFPIHLLPDIADCSSSFPLAGHWCGINSAARVCVALGDLQCAFVSCIANTSEAAMNLSTSAQLVCVMPDDFTPDIHQPSPSSVQYFPYFHGRFLAVAASLNGGNVLKAFVDMIHGWIEELGFECSEEVIWDKLGRDEGCAQTDSLTICPVLFGERHNPVTRASVTNIPPSPISLAHILRATTVGIVTNLSSMMSRDFLRERGVTRILITGSLVTQHPMVKSQVESVFSLPVVVGSRTDSATGAALVAAKLVV